MHMTSRKELCGRAKNALHEAFHRMKPDVTFDKSGYVRKVEDHILPGIESSDFEDDYRKGGGGELKKRSGQFTPLQPLL